MIRALRALARMRFRLFVNSMKRTGRRDTLEQISRAIAGVLPIVLTIALVPTALALAALGFYGGRVLAVEGGEGKAAVWWWAGIRLGLLAVTLTVVLLPLMRGAGGRESGLARLLLLPIPRRVLLLGEIGAGFGDPWLGLAVPFLLALPLGLISGGAPAAALAALGGAAALLLTLGALNACSSLGMTLVFRDRRRGEWLTLVGACLAFLIPVGISAVDARMEERGETGRSAVMRAAETPEEQLDRLLPGPARALPGDLYAGAVRSGLGRGRGRGAGLLGFAGLFAWCGAATAGAGALYGRLLETPGGSSRRVSARKAGGRARRLPGLSHAASAVARSTLRSTLRTVRGKIAVYLNVAILGVLLAVFRSRSELRLPEGSPFDLGSIAALAGIFFSSVAMQPVMLNLFANDRGGLSRQFLAPISFRDVALGKLAAGTGLIALSSALCAGLAFAVAPGGGVVVWLALGLVFLSSHLILGPLSVLLSAVFPKPSDLSRLGKQGNPHGLAGFLGFLLVPLTMAPGALSAAVALYGLERPLLALLLPAVWTALAALIAIPLFRLAVATVRRRSENLILVATGR